MTAVYAPLEETLANLFFEIISSGRQPEAVLTWVNCPSLTTAAQRYGIPVVHHELGALRRPHYRPTAYMDFRGVNANTESKDRFETFCVDPPANLLCRQELLALVSPVHASSSSLPAPPDFDLGLAFQLENDSNVLAYSYGYNNLELYWSACQTFTTDRILVRQHPSGVADYQRLVKCVDDSPSAREFINRCRAIATVNSSVGLEAALLGKPSCILGDNPFRFLASTRLDALPATGASDIEDLDRKLNFAILGYLVPDEFLFDLSYLRWRLTWPTEAAIYERHLAYYRTLVSGQYETEYVQSQQTISDLEMQNTQLQMEVEGTKVNLLTIQSKLADREKDSTEREATLATLRDTITALELEREATLATLRDTITALELERDMERNRADIFEHASVHQYRQAVTLEQKLAWIQTSKFWRIRNLFQKLALRLAIPRMKGVSQ